MSRGNVCYHWLQRTRCARRCPTCRWRTTRWGSTRYYRPIAHYDCGTHICYKPITNSFVDWGFAFSPVVLQMMKILTTPYVAFVEATFYGATFTTPIKVSLGIVTVGVLLASVNDVEVHTCAVNANGEK